MLSTLLDRTWTPTLLYGLFAWLLYANRHILSPNLFYAAIALSTAFYAFKFHLSAADELKIDRLGSRAPVKRTFTPWNLQTIGEAVYYFSHHRNHEFWWGMFGKLGGWTIESQILASRLIFTVDEENIKTILATQFGDYGKGKKFQEVRTLPSVSVSACKGK